MTRRFLLLAAGPTLFALQDEPHKVGRGVSPPRLLSKVEPEYSDEARKARLNGAVVLFVVVRPSGHADSIKIIRSLGLGLDEMAIASVERWRFTPGEKEGQPVAVQATIEVNFRLLPNHGFEAGWHSKRVTFQIPDGASRPTLQFAKFPPNGDPPEEGAVTISCLIDEQGMPTALRVGKSAPSLDAEAMAMLRQWRFNPAMKDGKPVPVPGTIELAFGAVAGPQKPKPAAVTL